MLKVVMGEGLDFAPWLQERLRGCNGFAKPYTTLAIGDERRILCVVLYSHYDGEDIIANIAAEPHTLWATKATLRAMFSYPFIDNNCRRITVLAAKANKRSRTLAERMGFTQEGCLRKKFQGKDVIVYGLLKEDCKWIRG
jgi:RimJ/RimL family protein N-acetyltransferase